MTATESARERAAWLTAAAILGAVAVLRGLRLPNRWSATQAQIDYGMGFVKRGLFGETASFLGFPVGHYTYFGYLAWALLLVALGLLAWFAAASGAARRFDNGSLTALFAGSFAVTYLAHLAGYLDIPLLCFAILALLARRFAAMLMAAGAAAIVGSLVHESYLLMFFPVTILPMVLLALAKPRSGREWVCLAALCCAAPAFVLFLVLDRPLSPADLAALQERLAARADFALRADFFEVLTRSAGDNLRIMWEIMHQGYWWRDHLVAGVTMFPAIAFFLWSGCRAASAAYGGWRRWAAFCAILGAGLSPLLLQFAGWDLYRWYALTVVTSFLTMAVAGRACLADGAVVALGARTRVAAVLLIGLNMASGEGLMDGQRTSPFPFKSYAPLLQDIQAHGGRLPIPSD